MSAWADMVEISITLLLTLLLAVPLGRYLALVYANTAIRWFSWLRPIELGLYRLAGVTLDQEQHWTTYARSLLWQNLLLILLCYGLLRLQHLLPLNPQDFGPVTPDLAFNIAAGFVANGDWQAYTGEAVLSQWSQMVALVPPMFLSAATGMAVGAALGRGFARRGARTIGCFTVDMVRSLLYVLLPLAVVASISFIALGTVQSLSPPVTITTLEGVTQQVPLGPVAGQHSIMLLGTNGGGYYGANAAHPFHNPGPLANLLGIICILLIPAAFPIAFGHMIGQPRQGRALLAIMLAIFCGMLALTYIAERAGNPLHHLPGVTAIGNPEGKEVRFSTAGSALWAAATSTTGNGSVNAMFDSFTPLGGAGAFLMMVMGGATMGGVGTGLGNTLMYALLVLFLAGQMIGRSPHYLQKKIERPELLCIVLPLVLYPLVIMGGSALSLILPVGLASVHEPGPHGITETIYAYASALDSNGSAFAGFKADTPYQNTMLGMALLLGRYLTIVPLLAIAGRMAAKMPSPNKAAQLPTTGMLFVGLVLAGVMFIDGLTFLPVVLLGPLANHAAMLTGVLY